MTDELVLSLRGVSAGYREGGILGRKRFHEVIHDVSFDVHRGRSWGWWANPALASPRWLKPFSAW